MPASARSRERMPSAATSSDALPRLARREADRPSAPFAAKLSTDVRRGELDAGSARRVAQRGEQRLVRHHVRERLALRDAAVEGQEDRPHDIAGAAVGDLHREDRLRLALELLPRCRAARASASPPRRSPRRARRACPRSAASRRSPRLQDRARPARSRAPPSSPAEPPPAIRMSGVTSAMRHSPNSLALDFACRRCTTFRAACRSAESARGRTCRPPSKTCSRILDLEPLEHNLFRGRSPEDGWQRVFGGQVIGQALVAAIAHRRAGPQGAFAARLFPAARRSRRADHLRGRPHPRRQELHHPPRRRHPARPRDLLHVGVVPGRGGRASTIRCRRRKSRRPKS